MVRSEMLDGFSVLRLLLELSRGETVAGWSVSSRTLFLVPNSLVDKLCYFSLAAQSMIDTRIRMISAESYETVESE